MNFKISALYSVSCPGIRKGGGGVGQKSDNLLIIASKVVKCIET